MLCLPKKAGSFDVSGRRTQDWKDTKVARKERHIERLVQHSEL